MEAVEKALSSVVDTLEAYPWDDARQNQQIFTLTQNFINCFLSSYLKCSAKVVGISIDTGEEVKKYIECLPDLLDIERPSACTKPDMYESFRQQASFAHIGLMSKAPEKSHNADVKVPVKDIINVKRKKGRPKNKPAELHESCLIKEHQQDCDAKNQQCMQTQSTHRYGTRKVRKRKKPFTLDDSEGEADAVPKKAEATPKTRPCAMNVKASPEMKAAKEEPKGTKGNTKQSKLTQDSDTETSMYAQTADNDRSLMVTDNEQNSHSDNAGIVTKQESQQSMEDSLHQGNSQADQESTGSSQESNTQNAGSSTVAGKAPILVICSYCGLKVLPKRLAVHKRTCKDTYTISTRNPLLQLPQDLPGVSCPYSHEQSREFKKLTNYLDHIIADHMHAADLTCPQCDWHWPIDNSKLGTAQYTEDFATKVIMHFVLFHDHLVPREVQLASQDTENYTVETSEQAQDQTVTENIADSCQQEQAPDQGLTASGNDMQTETSNILTIENAEAIEDVTPIEHIVTSTAMSEILSSADLTVGATYSVCLQSGETDEVVTVLTCDEQDFADYHIQVVSAVESIKTHETYTEYQIGKQENQNGSKENEIEDSEQSEQFFATLPDPDPKKPIYYCVVCSDKPRYMSLKTFSQHMHDFHVKSEHGYETKSIECVDCEELITCRIPSHHMHKEMVVECLILHQMLHHCKPKPEFVKVLQCKTCQFETICQYHYKQHVLKSTGCRSTEAEDSAESTKHQCSICVMDDNAKPGQEFPSKSAYQNHVHKVHMFQTDQKLCLDCKLCDAKYNVSWGNDTDTNPYARKEVRALVERFVRHLWQTHAIPLPCQDKLLQCPVCSYSHISASHIQRHREKQHRFLRERAMKAADETLCEKCAGLVKTVHYDEHYKYCQQLCTITHNNSKVMCELCGSLFTSSHYVSYHRAACEGHMKSADKAYTCNICHNSYYSKKQLQDHLWGHKKKQSEYKCGLCGASVRNRRKLEEHMITAHRTNISNKELVKCSICDFAGLPHTIDRHCRAQHPFLYPGRQTKKKKEVYLCSLCGFSASVAVSLKSHMAHKHQVDRHDCHLCKHTSLTRKGLENHLAQVHPHGERDVNYCQACQKLFSSNTAYHNHMFCKHKVNLTKRTVLQCEKCGFQALGNSLLKVHMKSHIIDLFVCPHCAKTFKTAENLRSHTRIAHGEKKFKCSECESAFTARYMLEKHVARNHTNQCFKCTQCKYTSFKEVTFKLHLHNVHNYSMEAAMNLTEVTKTANHRKAASKALADTSSLNNGCA